MIVDNQPLRIGESCLPEWLQRKKGLFALDTFSDNLCVFRCLAVHLGNGPGVRSGPRHRNHGTTAQSLNCLSFYPRDNCIWSVRRRRLCSSWSFFPQGEEEEKSPPLPSRWQKALNHVVDTHFKIENIMAEIEYGELGFCSTLVSSIRKNDFIERKRPANSLPERVLSIRMVITKNERRHIRAQERRC